MNDLFNKSDVLTVLTREQVKVGDKGYFGDNLDGLATDVAHNEVHSLVKIYDEDFTLYPFKGDHHGNSFALFLPADKVKNKESTYRPLANLDELFNFLIPDFDENHFGICDEHGKQIEFDVHKKAEILLGQKIILKNKIKDRIRVMVIQDVDFSSDSSDSSDTYLNCLALDYLFQAYEIQKDGEFVPFGVEE